MKKILISLFLLSSILHAADEKILLIVADDLSRDWISIYGSVNKTPHIDKLAENGLRFKTSWQSAADKVMAEKNFLTGSYKGTGTPFPIHLKNAGYKTVYLGNANSNTLLKNESYIKKSGFDFYSINSGKVSNIEQEQKLSKMVLSNMNKPGKVFVMVRFSKNSLKSKADYKNYLNEIDSFVNSISSLLSKKSKAHVIFTSISGSKIHEKVLVKLDRKSSRNPFTDQKKFKEEKFSVKDIDLCLPLIVKSPLIPESGLFTRDLTDGTDVSLTVLDIAGIKLKEEGNSKSFKPSIAGQLDPRQKRNWIFCNAGKERLIRSWEYVYYTNEKIYEINSDPQQKMNLLVGKNNNKIYAGERVRLKMIYEREFLGKKPKIEELIKVETLQK